MIAELNLEAYGYIALLELKPKEPPHLQKAFHSTVPEDEVINLGEVDIQSESAENPFSGELRYKFGNVNDKLVGLNEANFARFKNFLKGIYELPTISSAITFKKLSELGFDWLLGTYSNPVGRLEIVPFIEKEIERLTDNYIFHFKVEGLLIEAGFQIGHTKFEYFGNTEVLERYKKFVGEHGSLTFEDFQLTAGKQYKGLNAIVSIRGEIDRATEQAFLEAELAIDVLKCFCFEYLLSKKVKNFDLDYRYPGHQFAHYLYTIENGTENCMLSTAARRGVQPIEVTKTFLAQASKDGLELCSGFLLNRSSSEIDHKILDMIKLFAQAASAGDHYEKITKCISLFESMAIPEGNPKAKGFTLFKKVSQRLIPEEHLTRVQAIGLDMYKVRDRFMHNNDRWPFEIMDLLIFMDFMRVFILKAINISRARGNMEALYAYYGIVVVS